MASSYSFDIICEVDLQEADNAVNQARKEIEHRYDLRGSNCTIELMKTERQIILKADGEHFITAAGEIMRSKMIKRGISVLALDEQKPEQMGGKSVRQVVGLKNGLSKEDAKKITTLIKDSKLKVTAQIQDEKVRVTGKDKDELQAVMTLVRGADLGFPVQFENMR
ncbi:MAG: YajQ family cyclic di-GMP-binding protein ['Candidatus Kapabacteria' thiocyanatum]|uniref:Nucleotide-binding protein BGO89_04340 n=1 Tax=Candidatus Kapaibacterium thiocyanatum TaxID=1895771 RepID=A0A1M3L5L3_9BACT|nr:YajQ family cyclic di-GMP-binding protein ['Candidatus Kapabacteria' thiocyanatum]OJX60799.1 MAG: YajQ family cyclic di-GMP-binding protein ['Candidatus Kapabacteria' thiocyanatum]